MAGVAAAATILSMGMSYTQGRKAARAQRRAAAAQERLGIKNAAAIEQETEEAARRARKEAAEREGKALAQVAASGQSTKGPGSTTYSVIEAMSDENKRQIAWLRRSGKSKARLAKAGAQVEASISRSRADQIMGNTYAGLFANVGQVHQQGKSAGWWT